MENYSTKFKYIVPIFLLVSFGTTTVTLLFRWLFTIKFEILPIKEEVFHIWLPLILPWIPISIWLRPKLRILKFKDKERGSLFFQMIAWGTIASMMFVSQEYIKTATGSLLQIKNVTEIKHSKSRYYVINDYDVVRNLGGVHTNFRPSGRYNEYLDFDTYFVYPILSKDHKNSEFQYWYGVKFHEQISNRISDQEKEERYKKFFDKSVKEFENYKFFALDYFEIIPHSDDRDGFIKAVENVKVNKPENVVILSPMYGDFNERNGNKLEWIFGSFGIGCSIFLFALIFPKYHEAEHKRQLKGVKPKSDDLVEMFKYLIPKDGHLATSIILDLNILVFLIMVFSGVHIISPNGAELLEWGGNRRTETMGGEWWRLVSSMFVHGGIMHLFLNVCGLVIAAIYIEPILGRTKYFLLYFVSGMCGSLASIYWYENVVSVGASGAIFGLYGSILGLLLTNTFPMKGRKGIFLMIGIYVGINLLFGLTGGIDNAAHIGGLLSGAVTGVVLYKFNENK